MTSVSPLRITTYNVNGVHNPIKREKILRKIKKEKAEVVFLQETHLSEKEHSKLKRMGFTQVFSASHKSGRRRGVATLISQRVTFELSHEYKDKDGRYNIVVGKLEGQEFTFINVYAPPGSDWSFYKHIFDMMITKSQGIVICGGDFNVRLNPSEDTSKQPRANCSVGRKIRKMIKELGIKDEFNPRKRDYTFYSSAHHLYSRIDYFFMYNKDLDRVEKCHTGLMDLSDHCPLHIEVNVNKSKNPFIWRLNSSILKGKIKEELRQEIQLYMQDNDNGEVSPVILWDACKAVLRGKIIAKSSLLKKIKQEKLKNLEQELTELEKTNKNKTELKTIEKIKQIRDEINQELQSNIQKKLLFLKQSYYEISPKSSKFLAYRLKKQQEERTIYKIKEPTTNKVTYKNIEIRKSFEKYYQKLYALKEQDGLEKTNALLNGLLLPTVSNEQNEILTKNITIQEIEKAINKLKPNKSPGPDGFNADWYKIYLKDLSPVLLRTFNWVLNGGQIPPSWKETMITVIPKEGKDRLDCSNYRPISLLNQDYKIFTSILAKRLELILPGIINLDQTGFIKNRRTRDNIRRTLNVINHIKKTDKQAIILGLDAQKAFDTVDWSFLFIVLSKFNFSSKFIKIIQELYNKPTGKIRINGGLSEEIKIERGCRQGCSISPLLFAIFIEPLAQWIRQNTKIHGIKINHKEQKLALFADDILIYLARPRESLPELHKILLEYGKFSGYKLNSHKSQVLTFKYSPGNIDKENFKINWDMDSIRYLGVTIPKDLRKILSDNYNPLMTKIKNDISRWNLIPYLGLMHRVEAIKMMMLPKLLYLFQTLPAEPPKCMFQEIDKLISRFIWQGKQPRNRFKTLQLSKSKGGLSLPNMSDYYKAAQINPLVEMCDSSYTAKWKEIECSNNGVPLKAAIGNIDLIKDLKDLNPCTETSLRTWSKLVKENKESCLPIRWIAYDQDFTPNKTDNTFKKWTEKGLVKYNDLYHKGCLRTFHDIKQKYGLDNRFFSLSTNPALFRKIK
uniref:Reverse transcriptase domain-containing protein n=1 Tax=Poecilia mexicana TaxID=48701 RepID=A0A3B3WIQ9_9TELE